MAASLVREKEKDCHAPHLSFSTAKNKKAKGFEWQKALLQQFDPSIV
jgi:hypothetical protein